MISTDIQIIGKLTAGRVLVAKNHDEDTHNINKQKIIEQLKKRDSDVRNHEMAHGANPELITIGPTQFDYTIGPDGKAYATGGKVILSTGRAKTDEEALVKAEALKKASMAPGEPSSQDFQAWNAAVAMESETINRIYSKNNNKIINPLLKGINFNTYS